MENSKAPVTKTMMHFNDFRFYTMPTLPPRYEFPAWFSIELGLFAGRLYVSFEECAAIRNYLQIHQNEEDDEECASEPANAVTLANNPVAFLLEWLTLRRQVQDIMQTPMGHILQGRSLSSDHPFFTDPGMYAADLTGLQVSTGSSNEVSHDDDSDDEDDDWHEYDYGSEHWEVVDGEEVVEDLDVSNGGEEPKCEEELDDSS